MEKVKFPDTQFSKFVLFEKMLSMRVFDLEVMRVGRVMCGMNEFAVKESYKIGNFVFSGKFRNEVVEI